jgi:hypothetical protein
MNSTILLVEIAFAALFTGSAYLFYRRYPALSTKLIGRFHTSTSHVTPYSTVVIYDAGTPMLPLGQGS